MQLFYTTSIENNFVLFDEEETRHLVVLRKQIGDNIHVTDGKGNLFQCEIVELTKKKVMASVLSILDTQPLRNPIHIAIAPTKNIDRLEWFLEKATEIGLGTITPVLCKRSERTKLRLDRLDAILLSAMKQSLQFQKPKLSEVTDFQTFIKNTPTDCLKFIAYCNDDSVRAISDVYTKNQPVLILIGPEGDFTPEEVKAAFAQGFIGVSLGPNRLRTETAGLMACMELNFLNR
jgi:16S rRNA (uracil1498-N3)-methyltransferase